MRRAALWRVVVERLARATQGLRRALRLGRRHAPERARLVRAFSRRRLQSHRNSRVDSQIMKACLLDAGTGVDGRRERGRFERERAAGAGLDGRAVREPADALRAGTRRLGAVLAPHAAQPLRGGRLRSPVIASASQNTTEVYLQSWGISRNSETGTRVSLSRLLGRAKRELVSKRTSVALFHNARLTLSSVVGGTPGGTWIGEWSSNVGSWWWRPWRSGRLK